MELKKTHASRSVKIPTKRTVNLAKRESHKRDMITLTTGTFIILVLCFCVAKFGVIDQLSRLNAAERAYNEVHTQYVEMQEAVANYPAVEQEYRTYSRKWMNEDSSVAVSVDRTEVLDLIENHMMNVGNVETFTISGDLVLINMNGMNLEEISLMLADLSRQDIVASTALTIASTTKTANEDVDFSVTVTLQSPAEEEAAA